MAKTTKPARLDTKSERAKLQPSGTPYYVSLGENLHLGYRKGKKGGKWLTRRRIKGKYVSDGLADADDARPADGATILTYPQAQDAARRWAGLAPVNETAKPPTMADAMADYLRFLENHRKSAASARNRAENDILPQLGHFQIDQLTTAQLRQWHEVLPPVPV